MCAVGGKEAHPEGVEADDPDRDHVNPQCLAFGGHIGHGRLHAQTLRCDT